MPWRWAASRSTGSSSRQGPHHDAHTFSSQTWPRNDCTSNCWPGACSSGRLIAGAGLSIMADGTARGSRDRPIARKTAIAMKTPNGSR
ncbi:hypothetical protein G6F31_017081 [Rhizopus arrhizus]|nr:hypothetical protein G6F31_017081 [Rhizopus arrhizus]